MRINTICTICCMLILLVADVVWAANDLARQVLAEINLARTEPHHYASYLRDFRRRFEGKGYWWPGSLAVTITNEGAPAVDEAIRFLERQSPLPPLKWSDGLAEAAADLVQDEGQSGEVGHSGSRSGDMRERIERHGTWTSRIAENIGYGPRTARLMVMELIVDDGVPGRGHRKNIFTREFSVAGADCGPHPLYRTMCVIDFAGGYK